MTSSYQINSLRDFFEKGEEITKKPLSDSVITEYETLVKSAENFIKNLEINSPERPQAEKALQTLRESFVKLQETSNANKQKIQEELRTEWETLRKSVVEITPTHSSQNFSERQPFQHTVIEITPTHSSQNERTSQEKDSQEKNSQEKNSQEKNSQEKNSQEKNSESQEASQTKPAEYKREPITEKVQEELNEFQKEAFEAFKKQTLGENGQMDELSFRRGIEFLSELSNFSNIEVEKGKFDWLDTKEKEMLLKQMPAVQGIIGSIFVEQFFRAGYEFGFNADNTVIVKPKHAGQQTKARELETQLNNQIARNPHFANSIKAGLLYNNQDLLTYLRMNATSDGKEISEDAQKPENFIKFLQGRNTDSAKAILASRNFFKDLDWEGHLHAASYVPSFSKKLSVIMNDPETQQAIAQNFTQNQSAPETQQAIAQNFTQNQSAPNRATVLFNTMTAPDDSLNKPLPTLKENIDKHGYAGGMLTHTGMLWGRGFKTLFSSPEAGTLTIAAMIILPFVVGFKKAMGIFAGTPLALGLIDNFTNDWKPKKSNEGASENEENDPPTTSADQMGIKDLVPEKRRALIESTYPKEEVEPMIKATAAIQTEKVGSLRNYIEGNANAKISDNAKQSLETENNKELAKKHIETLRNKEIELAKQSGQLTEEGLKVYTQLLDDMRLSQLEWYSVSSIEERTKTINAYMQKKSEPNTSKNSGNSENSGDNQSFLWQLREYGFYGAMTLIAVKLMGGGPLLKGAWWVTKWVVKGGYGKVLKPAGKAIFDKGKTALDKVTGRRRIITLNSGEQVMLSRAAYRDYIYLRNQYQELMNRWIWAITPQNISEINTKTENLLKEALKDNNFKAKILAEYGTSTLNESQFLDDMKWRQRPNGSVIRGNIRWKKKILAILLH